MKEDDIRPAKLREKCKELFWLDSQELLEKSKDFIEVNCPACDYRETQVEFNKDGYIFKKCPKCRTLYISPRPIPEILKEYYSTSRASKFWQEEMFLVSRNIRIKEMYGPRAEMVIDLVKKYKIKTDILVDIGAGSGDFGVELAKRNVFRKIILVEPGPLKIEKNQNVEIIHNVIENVKFKHKPDIITNFELIEHLFSPLNFVRSIYNLLDDTSFFIFTMPNLEGLELLTIYDKSINLAGPDHLNYFNTESIKTLLKRVGFKFIEISTTGKLDADIVRNRHLEGAIDISSQLFLYHILIEKPELYLESFQGFLQQNNLSSNMLVVAKK